MSPNRRIGERVGWFAPLLGGLLVAFSLPPFGIWPLAIAGVAVLSTSTTARSARGRAAAGGLFGIGQLAVGLGWALKFSLVGYVVLVLVESAMVAVAVAVAPSRHARAPALAGLLTLAEWLRDVWPFGGLPLGGIALGQVGGPLLPTARLGGPLLVAGLTYLAGAALGEIPVIFGASRGASSGAPLGAQGRSGHYLAQMDGSVRSGARLAAVAVELALVVGVSIWGALAPSGGPPTRILSVDVVQGGGLRGYSQIEIPPAHVLTAALSETAKLTGPVDLVLWPEDVVALDEPIGRSPVDGELAGVARRLHTTLVVGATWPVGATRYRNEILAYSPSGRLVSSFEKVHRVPFGEYVPWRSFFSRIANLSAVPRDAIAGTGSGMIPTPAGRLAVLVSYEVFFPDRGRSGVRAGGQLIVVPTNTSSYSSDQAPSQEIAASRLQAVSEGRDLLQAAPTGYSAVINSQGTVRELSALSVPAILRASVALRSGSTLFERFGELPVLLLAAAAVLAGWASAIWFRAATRRKRGVSGGG